MDYIKKIANETKKLKRRLSKDVVGMCKLPELLRELFKKEAANYDEANALSSRYFKEIYWSLKLHLFVHGEPQIKRNEEKLKRTQEELKRNSRERKRIQEELNRAQEELNRAQEELNRAQEELNRFGKEQGLTEEELEKFPDGETWHEFAFDLGSKLVELVSIYFRMSSWLN